MGWTDDLWSGTKKIGKKTVSGLDKATDLIVDKDAWADTAKALADGPGGREVKTGDLVNMLLDSTMLIPGVGIAGAGARVAGRAAAKKIGQEGAEAIAKKAAAKTALRSPVNNMVRGKVDDAAQLVREKAAARLGAATGKGTGKRMATKTASDAPSNQLQRIAAKQQAGIGRKVGFGQTKKRIMANTAMSAGANLLTRAYDEGVFGPGGDGGGAGGGPGGAGGGPGGAGGGGGIYLVGADGSQQALPAGFMDALAAFMQQNGGVGGQQVIYSD